MDHRNRLPRIGALLALIAVSVGLAACGGSGSDPSAASLLKETFGGSHTIKSGQLNVGLTLDPSGSTTIKGPISLSFGGPFQSRGTGKLPESNFTVKLSALGRSGSVGIISTGTTGYVSLQGSNYQLPQATFQKLESSFSQLASSSGSGSSSGVLSKLGIDPMHWLTNPQVVGTETVGGVATTHIHAGINVSTFLSNLDAFLQKASKGISSSTITAIAGAIQNPSVDIWTGNSDKALRKLQIHLTVPVSGQISTLLGGLHSAGIGLSMAYSDLNQPQTITAPTSLKPYSQFQGKLATLFSAVQGSLSGAAGGLLGGGSSGTGATGGTGTGTTGKYQSYSACITAANGDVAKMQHCASLLNP